MATLDDLLIGVGVAGMRDLRSDFDRVSRMADDAVETTESLFDRMRLRAPTDKVKDDFGVVGTWARQAADDAENAFEGMQPRFSGVDGGARSAVSGAASVFKGLAGPLSIAAGAAGAAAGAVLVHEFVDAIEDERLEDKLAAQLDLTAERADEYGQLASDLYAGAWGDSLAAVHDAIDAVDSTLGDLDIDEIEDLTVHALDLAAAFDSDVDEAVNAAGVLMKTGLADDGEDAFDLITKAMQSVPRLMRDELIPIIEEYSQDFAGLGIDGEDAMGLLVDAAQVGRFELDKTGDAIKELTIRASDMSAASQEAYATIGLDAEEMSRKIVSGGREARDAFDQIIDGLLDIEDPAAQANTAIALFGTPLEDLSVTEIPAFLERMDDMEGRFGNAEGAASQMGDTLNTNVATDIESFRRRAGAAIDEWVEAVVIPRAAEVIDAFEEGGVGGALSKAVELWRQAQPEVQAWWDGTFKPFWENTAVPWMEYVGAEMGIGLTNGLIEILAQSLPLAVEGIINGLNTMVEMFVNGINDAIEDVLFLGGVEFGELQLPDLDLPGLSVPNIDNPVEAPGSDRVYNPDRADISGGRTVSSATGSPSVTVNNYYPTPSSAAATTESYRRAAMEFA